MCWRAVGSKGGWFGGTQEVMCRKDPLPFSSMQGPSMKLLHFTENGVIFSVTL